MTGRLARRWQRLRPVLASVGEGVLLPVGVYLILSFVGLGDLIALTGSAGAAVVVLGVRWWRTRTVNALGIVVLIRFALSLAMIGIVGDARLLLIKDALITAAIALIALATVGSQRTFIARIQADLSGDRELFDRQLSNSPTGQTAFRRLTFAWGLALLIEPALEIMIIILSPIPVAVVITNLLGTFTILLLIVITIRRTRQLDLPTP